MTAAARIRKLKFDPAIRTVDVVVSISGTRHSVPFTLTQSCKLVTRSLARVSYFKSSTLNLPDTWTLFGTDVYAIEPLERPSQESFRACARLFVWSSAQASAS